MADGGPRFPDDPTKIAANPSAPWVTLLSTIIKDKNTEFRAPFTNTPGEREFDQFRPILALIRVWMDTASKWRMETHDFWRILPKIAAYPLALQTTLFPTLIAAKHTAFLAPFTHSLEGCEIDQITPILFRV